MAKAQNSIARLVKIKQSNDDFDIRFWQKAGPRAIFDAMGQMVSEYFKWRGHGRKPRLRRSVAVLKRRKG